MTLTAVLTVVVSTWAALSVAASVVALSWLLIASLLPLFLLAPFLQRAAVVRTWWRGLPSIELVGWSLLNFVVLTIGGALVWTVPGWWTAPVAAVTGLVNGLLWQRTVAAALLPRRRVRWARVPVAPLAACSPSPYRWWCSRCSSSCPGPRRRGGSWCSTGPCRATSTTR